MSAHASGAMTRPKSALQHAQRATARAHCLQARLAQPPELGLSVVGAAASAQRPRRSAQRAAAPLCSPAARQSPSIGDAPARARRRAARSAARSRPLRGGPGCTSAWRAPTAAPRSAWRPAARAPRGDARRARGGENGGPVGGRGPRRSPSARCERCGWKLGGGGAAARGWGRGGGGEPGGGGGGFDQRSAARCGAPSRQPAPPGCADIRALIPARNCRAFPLCLNL